MDDETALFLVITGMSAVQHMLVVGYTVVIYRGLMWCWRRIAKDHPFLNVFGILLVLVITAVLSLTLKWVVFRPTIGGIATC